MKPIKKAVFPVAGMGTRFLPATKVMPKELFPIVDRPLLQYAVDEALEAGIEQMIFVTGRGKGAIEDHFAMHWKSLPAPCAFASSAGVLFLSVPKRHLARAIDRNLVRRVAREAWRAAGLAALPVAVMVKLRRRPGWFAAAPGVRQRRRCLRGELDRLTDGGTIPYLPPWHVQENKWRTARYGMDAIIILDSRNRERLVTDELHDLLERLMPIARRLGCADELAGIEDIIRAGASYQRQLAVAESHDGDLVEVARSLVAEMRAGRPLPPT